MLEITLNSLPKIPALIFQFLPKHISQKDLLFLDIETTGLSKDRSYIYLIGCIFYRDSSWNCLQWMAEDKNEEQLLLKKFSDFSSSYHVLLHYNGSKFDLPFLEHRLRLYNLPTSLTGKESLDLYRLLLPCKPLWKLSHLRQTDAEAYLQLPPRCAPDGKEGIALYKQFLKKKDKNLEQSLLLHNQEDLKGLVRLLEALSYPLFLEGHFEVKELLSGKESLTFILECVYPFPQPFSFKFPFGYISAQNTRAAIELRLSEHRLPNYYKNYKDYYYVPSEDTIVPKCMAAYLSPRLREPAKPHNCYSWFSIEESFLNDAKKQHDYLTSLLAVLPSLG